MGKLTYLVSSNIFLTFLATHPGQGISQLVSYKNWADLGVAFIVFSRSSLQIPPWAKVHPHLYFAMIICHWHSIPWTSLSCIHSQFSWGITLTVDTIFRLLAEIGNETVYSHENYSLPVLTDTRKLGRSHHQDCVTAAHLHFNKLHD